MIPLFLTAAELKLFEKLPDAVRAGAKVEEEKLTFTDTAERMEARMRNLKIEHPALKKLQQESAGKQYKPEDIEKIAETIDLSGLSQPDLIELAFAWGPNMFTTMINAALPAVTSIEGLTEVAQLAGIRHGLLLSLSSAAPLR